MEKLESYKIRNFCYIGGEEFDYHDQNFRKM